MQCMSPAVSSLAQSALCIQSVAVEGCRNADTQLSNLFVSRPLRDTSMWHGCSLHQQLHQQHHHHHYHHQLSLGLCRHVTILNRSLPRAQELAAEFPEVSCTIDLMPALSSAVAAADVIFTASSSTEVLVRGSDLSSMPLRGQHVGGVRR